MKVGELLRVARIDGAYISLRDAAKALGYKPSELSDIEWSRVEPTDEEANRMLRYYDTKDGRTP